jgi:hypothetical protein
VLLSIAVTVHCQVEITAMQREVEVTSGVHVIWGFVDGFLLYWDQVYAHLAAILLHGAQHLICFLSCVLPSPT